MRAQVTNLVKEAGLQTYLVYYGSQYRTLSLENVARYVFDASKLFQQRFESCYVLLKSELCFFVVCYSSWMQIHEHESPGNIE